MIMEFKSYYKCGGAFNIHVPIRIVDNIFALAPYSVYKQIFIRTFRIIQVA